VHLLESRGAHLGATWMHLSTIVSASSSLFDLRVGELAASNLVPCVNTS
jgi:hypothetical protein